MGGGREFLKENREKYLQLVCIKFVLYSFIVNALTSLMGTLKSLLELFMVV
jgi:hypothetical protein